MCVCFCGGGGLGGSLLILWLRLCARCGRGWTLSAALFFWACGAFAGSYDLQPPSEAGRWAECCEAEHAIRALAGRIAAARRAAPGVWPADAIRRAVGFLGAAEVAFSEGRFAEAVDIAAAALVGLNASARPAGTAPAAD